MNFDSSFSEILEKYHVRFLPCVPIHCTQWITSL